MKWGRERHTSVCALLLNNSRLIVKCSVVPLTDPAEVTLGYCDPQEGEMSSLLMGGSISCEMRLSHKDRSNRTGAGNATILSGRGAGGRFMCSESKDHIDYNYRRREEAPFTMEL
jgi:hypothetical protein